MINRMLPDSRGRFGQFSELLLKEAKSSKNYLYSLDLWGRNPNYFTIEVRFHKKVLGYHLEFTRESNTNCMSYLNLKYQEIYKDVLNPSVSIMELAVKHFIGLLQEYKNSVKFITVTGSILTRYLRNMDIGVDRFDQLQKLFIFESSYFRQFLNAVHHPLETLRCMHDVKQLCPNYLEQIQKVKKHICFPSLMLNYEQFIGLSANDIEIHIGYLSVADIINFIKCWEDEKLGRTLSHVDWSLEHSKFDIKELFRRFGVLIDGTKDVFAKIQNQKTSRIGDLYCRRPYTNLVFHP